MGKTADEDRVTTKMRDKVNEELLDLLEVTKVKIMKKKNC